MYVGCQVREGVIQPCGETAFVRVTTGCRHEHVEVTQVCVGCLVRVRAGELVCTRCYLKGCLYCWVRVEHEERLNIVLFDPT